MGAEADKIRAQMNVFATAVHDHAVAYEAELLSYDALALPFPSPLELADKRDVLEDCLRQKQRYWSILADLRLARGADAGLFFSALPPAEELNDLIARFTSLLNDLMAHARGVADGTIEPELFEAVGRARAAAAEASQLDELRPVVDPPRRPDPDRRREPDHPPDRRRGRPAPHRLHPGRDACRRGARLHASSRSWT